MRRPEEFRFIPCMKCRRAKPKCSDCRFKFYSDAYEILTAKLEKAKGFLLDSELQIVEGVDEREN